MEELEVTEQKLSNILQESDKLRIDSSYYSKIALKTNYTIRNSPYGYDKLGTLCSLFSKGIFDVNAANYSESGIPFVRISNMRYGLIDEETLVFIPAHINELEKRTELSRGDIILSKTAYPAASIVTIDKCNVSQDTIAVKLAKESKKKYLAEYIVTFLNSKYGDILLRQQFQGNVQEHLSIPDGRKIIIPSLSMQIQQIIANIKLCAINQTKMTTQIYHQINEKLLSALNLTDWQPPVPLTYSSKSSLTFAANRLDAEYYQPKYDDLFRLLKQNSLYWRQVKDICVFNARGKQPDYYADGELPVINSRHILEYSLDYDNFERTYSEKWTTLPDARVLQNDILTYTTGANVGRTSPYLETSQALASNHVNILRLQEENPIYVAAVMNSMIGRMQTKRLITGSAQAELYPTDIGQFIIPFIDQAAQQEIIRSVLATHTARKTAKSLLEAAKRAVEIAIEDSEAAAITWLQEETARLGVTL